MRVGSGTCLDAELSGLRQGASPNATRAVSCPSLISESSVAPRKSRFSKLRVGFVMSTSPYRVAMESSLNSEFRSEVVKASGSSNEFGSGGA